MGMLDWTSQASGYVAGFVVCEQMSSNSESLGVEGE